MKHIRYFETWSEYQDAINTEYIEPWVSSVAGGEGVSYNLPKTVDLGLPSGTLWMTMNLGATNLFDVGDSYKWGELYPSTVSDPYRWSSPYSKYNTTDQRIYLDSEDDVLRVNSGQTSVNNKTYIYAIPTIDECIELDNAQYVTQSTDKTQNITIFTSRINGNYIIFPGTEGITVGTAKEPYFGIWTCQRNPSYFSYANSFQAYEDSNSYYTGIQEKVQRNSLRNIRGVLRPYTPLK